VAGIGQPPTTGATAGPVESRLRVDVEDIELRAESCATKEGNFSENSEKPPRMIYEQPFQPSFANFFSALIHVVASLSWDESES